MVTFMKIRQMMTKTDLKNILAQLLRIEVRSQKNMFFSSPKKAKNSTIERMKPYGAPQPVHEYF